MSVTPPPAPPATNSRTPDVVSGYGPPQVARLIGSPALFLVLGIGLSVIGYLTTLFALDDYARTAFLEPETAQKGFVYLGLGVAGLGIVLVLIALWRFAQQFHAVYRKLAGV